VVAVGVQRVLVGRYVLGSPLGSGGTAIVYAAHDRVLDRAVAVKVLRDQYATDPVFRARFTREALHVASLPHPGLVTVFDAGVDGDTAFIVMELVRGRTLREVLRADGPLPVAQSVGIAADVCSVLDAAHRAGVVHRDITPGNILIADDGRTRVLDFGIARADGSGALTQTMAVVGTIAYVSPEQAAGGSAGPQSDLYALGCVLTEMLTGAPPFTADAPVGLLYQHVNDAPAPPSARRPEVGPELDAVVVRLLDKDPAKRPATATEARRELLSALTPSGLTRTLTFVPAAGAVDGPGTAGVAAEGSRRSRFPRPAVWWVGAVTALVTVLGVLGLLAGGSPARPAAAVTSSPASTPSTTPTPAEASTPPAAAPSATTLPAISVAGASTIPGALSALVSVVQQGQAEQLVDATAASQLYDATSEVVRAVSRGNGHSAQGKVRDLAHLVDRLSGTGHIANAAVGPLNAAIDQLAQLVGSAD
jgi:serine/threonine-protein kinase